MELAATTTLAPQSSSPNISNHAGGKVICAIVLTMAITPNKLSTYEKINICYGRTSSNGMNSNNRSNNNETIIPVIVLSGIKMRMVITMLIILVAVLITQAMIAFSRVHVIVVVVIMQAA